MFEKFTERARQIMSLARQEAQRMDADYIGTEHILLAIVQENGGIAAKVLKSLNVDLKRLRQEVDLLVKPSSSPSVLLGHLPFSPRAKSVIDLSKSVASQFGHDVIGTEHLLIGLVYESEGIAYQAIEKMGLKPAELKDRVIETFGAPASAPALSEAGPASIKIVPSGVSLSWDESVANDLVNTWFKISGGRDHDLLKSMIVAALARHSEE